MEKYIELIKETNDAILLAKKYIIKHNNDQEKISGFKDMIFVYSLENVIAYYSSGASKDTVTKSLLEAITYFEDGFKWEGFEKSYAMYDQMVWMLSLGILCEIEDNDFQRIMNIIKRDRASDKLLSKLINYRLPNTLNGSGYIQKSPYAELDMLVTGSDKSSLFIKRYLDKNWYQGHSDAPWHDIHKNIKVNNYFGYWAWEVGALVKIFGVNDEELKNQQYYPYRANHW